MIIKVCGMRETKNICEVIKLDIDWMGFIFFKDSPRGIRNKQEATEMISGWKERMENIKGKLPVKKVGVFVNSPVNEILETARQVKLNHIQLHGNETPETCRLLQEQGYTVIKAFSVASTESFLTIGRYEDCTDYFLFDTPCKQYGGSGMSFDWSLLEAYQGKVPFLLSGGIGPTHVEAIKQFRHPRFAGIDLNSQFEICAGRKNVDKLSAFIKKIRE